jgi:hypothetical protein
MPIGGLIVVGIALAAVVLILAAGLSTLFVGGDVSGRWSNRLIVPAVLYFFRGP